MRINRIQIENYLGFRKTDVLELSPSMNLIVGQNNVGKSGLLKALALRFTARPYASEETKPTESSAMNPRSLAYVEVGSSGPEVREIMLTSGPQYYIATPPNFQNNPQSRQATLDSILDSETLSFQYNVVSAGPSSVATFEVTRYPSDGRFDLDPSQKSSCIVANVNPDRLGFNVAGPMNQKPQNEFGHQIADIFRSRIYFFHAERLQISRATFGNVNVLQPNCGNLAQVLNMLSSENPALFDDIVTLVRRIIPSVKSVSVVPISGSEVEIRIWPVEVHTRLSHLAVPLDECGTGVGQILAILYIVVTSRQPRVILIDEPASFLHPGASRELLRILADYRHHQYIVSTHSPELISVARSATFFLVRKEGSECTVAQIDPTQVDDATVRINRIQIENYLGFRKTDVLELSPSMNLIVGQNNVGKSGLLKALALRFTARPYASEETKPTESSAMNPRSLAYVEVGSSGPEVREIMLTSGPQYYIATPPNFQNNPQSRQATLDSILDSETLSFQYNVVSAGPSSVATFEVTRYPSDGRFDLDPSQKSSCIVANVNPDRLGFNVAGPMNQKPQNEFGHQIADIFRSRIYFFHAERLQISRATFGNVNVLQPNCGNLAQVLNMLSSENPALFDDIVTLVRRIIPSVKSVSVVPISGSEVEIRIWPVEVHTRLSHLAVPLDECGTGVGQILAILYIVVTSRQPRVILIDEPASFLHPGASRELLRILADYRHHQYIVSTHSPELISVARSATFFLVRKEGSECTVAQIDPTQVDDAKLALEAIGARLSDVYGADNIVWVEGPTEEECYPLLVKALGLDSTGTMFCPIRNTGSITSKRTREQTLEIYRSLSQPKALIPPALAFVIDREDLSDTDVEDLERHNGVRILKRRMYENYLLDAEAIAAVLNNTATFRDEKEITAETIQQWLDDRIGDESIDKIDAAKLLAELFSEISEGKEVYRKTTHSVELTRVLSKKDPDRFSELGQLLTEILVGDSDKPG